MWFWSSTITLSFTYTTLITFYSSAFLSVPLHVVSQLHFFLYFVDVGFRHYVNDSLMRFFDQCKRFVEDVEHNKTALKEVKLFKSSPEMDEVCMRMANRLRVPHSQITPGKNVVRFYCGQI